MENLRQEVLDAIDGIKIPTDLENVEVSFIPVRNDVLILPSKKGERKALLGTMELILPEFEQSSQPIGRIVALGPKCQPYLKKGLLVMYSHMTAMPVSIGQKEYVIVEDFSGIRGIIVDEKKVEVITEPVSPLTIDRRNRIARDKKIQKDMNREFNNKVDEIHEKAKYQEKNPTTSNRKS
jgi:co-chaperonin GroES (HSP10)